MIKKTTLKNGLRIITIPMKDTNSATILVMTKTGSRDEDKEINGISHFLEHMVFKGTKKRPNTLAIAEELDGVGGESNAATGPEETLYYAKVNGKHIDLALDVVSDIFLNPELREEDIERERGVIIEEINMYQDTPMSYVSVLFEKLLYEKENVGWNIAGEKKNILKFKRKDFLEYRKKHYTAKNTVVCVSGKIDSKKLIEKIKKDFSKINKQNPKKRNKIKETQKSPQDLIYYKKTDQTHLCIGARAYNIFHPDKYALSLLSVILGGNMSSRLFMSVREKEGLAYYVKTTTEGYTDTGYIVTQAGVDNKRVERTIEIILNEYKKIKEKGVSLGELTKAKEYVKGRAILGLESSDDMASFAASQEILTGNILTLKQKFEKINKVKESDIQKVAKEIFVPEKLNLALIGPFKRNPCPKLSKQL